MPTSDWFRLTNADEVESPALLISPAVAERNLQRMIATAGSAARLWPHVKTHKLAPIIERQIALGITKCKAATLAEAAMCAEAGVEHVLLAYPVVGRNAASFIELLGEYPTTHFATLADAAGPIAELSRLTTAAGMTLDVLLDVDCGMHRTGIAPGPAAIALYREISLSPGLRAAGLHAYDGHIGNGSLAERTAAVDAAFVSVRALRRELESAGLRVPRVIAGGTPTFPVHATHADVECSPGTTTLFTWYLTESCPDLDYEFAAVLFARVISRPHVGRLTIDLGHKAVASENPPDRRVRFPDLPDARVVGHSEEHLVVETSRAADFPPGSVLYAYPWHICPTVALHGSAIVVEDRRATGAWPITARDRCYSIGEKAAR